MTKKDLDRGKQAHFLGLPLHMKSSHFHNLSNLTFRCSTLQGDYKISNTIESLVYLIPRKYDTLVCISITLN